MPVGTQLSGQVVEYNGTYVISYISYSYGDMVISRTLFNSFKLRAEKVMIILELQKHFLKVYEGEMMIRHQTKKTLLQMFLSMQIALLSLPQEVLKI